MVKPINGIESLEIGRIILGTVCDNHRKNSGIPIAIRNLRFASFVFYRLIWAEPRNFVLIRAIMKKTKLEEIVEPINLPHDVIVLVFKFLKTEDSFNFALVSKQMYKAYQATPK